jgi:hypothetical protein
MIPLIKGFRANTYLKAFLLNAICTAFIATTAVYLKEMLNDDKNFIYLFLINKFSLKELSILQIFLFVFFITFLSAFMVYILMYILFQFGAGMIISHGKISFY